MTRFAPKDKSGDKPESGLSSSGPTSSAPEPPEPESVQNLWWAALVLSCPAGLALAAVWLTGYLPLAAEFSLAVALTAWLAILGVSAMLIRRRSLGLAIARRFLRTRTPPSSPDSPASPEAARAALAALADRGGEMGDLARALIHHDRLASAARTHHLIRARRDARIADALPDPVLVVDAALTLITANRAAHQAFGERIVGRDLATLVRAPDLRAAIDTAFRTHTRQSVEIGQPEAGERVFRVRCEPVAGPSPNADPGADPGPDPGPNAGSGPDQPADMVLLYFADRTEIRRSEATQADFVANVSHELRTPLASLRGFVETLQGPARTDAQAQETFLDIMMAQTTRMTRLVEDLLSLSRIEAQAHQAPTDRVALADVLERALAAAALAAGRKGMTVRLDLEDDAEDGAPWVAGDADALGQVAQNLIDNAIRYGRDGGEITITVARAHTLPASYPRHGSGALALTVADQGEGIARAHIPRLTERFYRVDAARSRALGGTGLGLAIVKHIVARHRGALTISSEVGVGSVFTVYLPIYDASTEHQAAP